MKRRLRKDIMVYGLVLLAATVLIVATVSEPLTQADMFDSPVPQARAYLPFVASQFSWPQDGPYRVYLPIVTHEWISTPSRARAPR